jgi:hypothetical protein
MEKSSQIAWKIVPLRHFFPLKVVPLIEVLLYYLSARETKKNAPWYQVTGGDRFKMAYLKKKGKPTSSSIPWSSLRASGMRSRSLLSITQINPSVAWK